MPGPPAAVLRAFGLPVSAPALRLEGGQGTAYAVGHLVLKPTENLEAAAWAGEVYSSLEPAGFRVPAPVPSGRGGWAFDGWTAWERLEGRVVRGGRFEERLEATRAFHRALEDYPRPDFLDRLEHPWARADRVVWQGDAWQPRPEVACIYDRLCGHARPLRLPEQLIHGDVSGNILFAQGRPPAVIDFSPYWRPAFYAEAILLVDCLLWEDAPWTILELAGSADASAQLLIRAAMWRLATEEFLPRPAGFVPRLEAFERLCAGLSRLF